MKTLLASLLATVALSAPITSLHAQEVRPLDGIAAVVDEEVVLRSELDRAVANITSQYAGRDAQLPPRDVLEKQVLERLVLVKLQVARAEGTGVRVTDQEVDQAISAIAAQNGGSPETLRAQIERDGTSYADFRRSIRDELTIQRLRQRFAQTRVSVSDAEVEAAMSLEAAGGDQYRLAHILVALPEGPSAEQIATAEKKINGVKALIDKGEITFEAAAVRYSDSPNALEGGDLGFRGVDEIPRAFAAQVRSMTPGQVTEPVRGPSGFQVLKLVEIRAAAGSAAALATQYNARHILVRVDENTTDAQARATAETLRARIEGGADFAKVARDESEDVNSRPRGGDLGWFTADQFGPEFGDQVRTLSDNEVSQPIRTQAGWHLVQRLGTRQADVGADNRRAALRETIGRRKLEDEWSRFLRELRGEAFVDVRVGAAAPREEAASGG